MADASRLPDLYQHLYMLIGPGEAQKWVEEARMANPPGWYLRSLIFNRFPSWTCKSWQKSNWSFRSHSEGLPWLHWLVQYLHLQTKERWIFWVPYSKEVTQPALAARLVNGLSPEISGLIKKQKIGWKVTSLSELVTQLSTLKRLCSKTKLHQATGLTDRTAPKLCT